MSFYSEMAGIADELLREFRQGAILLTRTTTEAGNPATPWIAGGSTTNTFELRATARGVSSELVDGTNILATDLEVMIGPLALHTFTDGYPANGAEVEVALQAADIISIDGRAVTVLRTIRLPAAGTLVAWKAIVRV